MHSFENTFIRGPSPSYSDDTASENALSATLPIGEISTGEVQYNNKQFMDKKFNSLPRLTSSQERSLLTFWVVISVLFILTVGNLMLTVTIIGVLHMGKGLRGMELVPEEDMIKFYGSTDLDRIYSRSSSQIEGFADVPVTITGDDGAVSVRLLRNGQTHNRLTLDKDGIQLRGINSFELKDLTSSATIFSTHRPHYNMPSGAEALVAKTISATRLSSSIEQPLKMESDNKLIIRGSEGIFAEAGSLLWQSEHNIALNASLGSIVLSANSGIFLDMHKIPIVSPEWGLRTGSVQYKLCACMPQGTLFRVPVPRVHNGPKITCAHFDAQFNPCVVN